MKKLIKSLLIMTLSVLLLSLSFLPTLSQTAAANANGRLAVLEEVVGSVTLIKVGGKKEFKAVNGMTLNQGDTIKTGKDSFARVVFQDGSEASISSSSQVVITELDNKDGGNQRSLRVVAGKVWSKVKSLVNANDSYNLETPTAIMGVRGTLFLTDVSILNNQDTFDRRNVALSVLQGLVSANPKDSENNFPHTFADIIPDHNWAVGTFESLFVQQAPAGVLEKLLKDRVQVELEKLIETTDDTMLGQIVSDILEDALERNQLAQEQLDQFNIDNNIESLEQSIRQQAISRQMEETFARARAEMEKQQRLDGVEQMLRDRNRQIIEELEKQRQQLQEEQERRQQVLIEKARQVALDDGRMQRITEHAQNPRLALPNQSPTPPAPTPPAPPTPTPPANPGTGGGGAPGGGDTGGGGNPGGGDNGGGNPDIGEPSVDLAIDAATGRLIVRGSNLQDVYALQIHIGHDNAQIHNLDFIGHSGNQFFPSQLNNNEVNLLTPVGIEGLYELIYVQTLFNINHSHSLVGTGNIVTINLPSELLNSTNFWLNKVLIVNMNGEATYQYIKE